MLLQAQSGHGKTAIFATAILNAIDTGAPDKEAIQAIVLVPNRDLARQVNPPTHPPTPSNHPPTHPFPNSPTHLPLQQVTAEIEALGQYLEPKLRIQCCVGSPNIKTEEVGRWVGGVDRRKKEDDKTE